MALHSRRQVKAVADSPD